MANTVRCFHSRSLGLDILARRRHHGNGSAFRSLELGPNHRPLQAALSGSLIKAPGFAGGYLLHCRRDALHRRGDWKLCTTCVVLLILPGDMLYSAQSFCCSAQFFTSSLYLRRLALFQIGAALIARIAARSQNYSDPRRDADIRMYRAVVEGKTVREAKLVAGVSPRARPGRHNARLSGCPREALP